MVWLCRRTKPIFSGWESLVNQNLKICFSIEQNVEAFEGPIRKAMILTELDSFPAPALIELRFKSLPFGISPGVPDTS
jgi:hypothetical protein